MLHEATHGGVKQVSYVMTGYAYAHIVVPRTVLTVGAMSLVCGFLWLWQVGAGPVAELRGRAAS